MAYFKNFSFIKTLAIFLFLISFLPLEFMFGEIKGFKWTMTPYIWFLSMCILFFSSWLINAVLTGPWSSTLDWLDPRFRKFLTSLPKFWYIILFFEMSFISEIAFSRHPLLIDEIVQVFQAKIFHAGRIKAVLPKYPEFFVTQHMIFDEAGWYSQYPPGHSLVILTSFLFFGLSWLSPLLLAVCSIFILSKFTKNIFGIDISNIFLLLSLLCPFFLFMSSSHMNHVSSFFLISCFIYAFERWESTNKTKYLFLTTLCAGLSILVRPLDIIAASLFLIPSGLKILKGNLKQIFPAVLGILPGVLGNLYYNNITTGNILTPGYIKLWGDAHGLGFHESPWGIEHTPLTGLRNELVDLQLLNEMLFEWPVPSLLPIAVALFFCSYQEKWSKRLLFIGLSFPLTYFFYWHRDAYLGPRFMYSGLVAWLPLTAYSLVSLNNQMDDKKIRLMGLFRSFYLRNFYLTLILFSFLFFLIFSGPQRLKIYSSSFASGKVDIFEKARLQGISAGLILIKTSWGVRIISELRGKSISASLAQKAYSKIDHCELDSLLKSANKKNLSNDNLKSEIESKIKENHEIKYPGFGFDLTLKLDPKKLLTEECKEEIKYDIRNNQQDFTVYEPHMRANQPDFSGDFVIAKDLRSKNPLLLQQFPHLKAYIYNGNDFRELK